MRFSLKFLIFFNVILLTDQYSNNPTGVNIFLSRVETDVDFEGSIEVDGLIKSELGSNLELNTGTSGIGLVFTSATGVATFENSTDSTSYTTGGLLSAGGVGIAKNLNAGGTIGSTLGFTGPSLTSKTTSDLTLNTTDYGTAITVASGTGVCTFAENIAGDLALNPSSAYSGHLTGETELQSALSVLDTLSTSLANNFTVGDSGADYTTIASCLSANTATSTSPITIRILGKLTETVIVITQSYVTIYGTGNDTIHCTTLTVNASLSSVDIHNLYFSSYSRVILNSSCSFYENKIFGSFNNSSDLYKVYIASGATFVNIYSNEWVSTSSTVNAEQSLILIEASQNARIYIHDNKAVFNISKTGVQTTLNFIKAQSNATPSDYAFMSIFNNSIRWWNASANDDVLFTVLKLTGDFVDTIEMIGNKFRFQSDTALSGSNTPILYNLGTYEATRLIAKDNCYTFETNSLTVAGWNIITSLDASTNFRSQDENYNAPILTVAFTNGTYFIDSVYYYGRLRANNMQGGSSQVVESGFTNIIYNSDVVLGWGAYENTGLKNKTAGLYGVAIVPNTTSGTLSVGISEGTNADDDILTHFSINQTGYPSFPNIRAVDVSSGFSAIYKNDSTGELVISV